tara:strand:+ start:287 stop:469 length:183 start_codon:yes stop_codon:yes gene_type:complete
MEPLVEEEQGGTPLQWAMLAGIVFVPVLIIGVPILAVALALRQTDKEEREAQLEWERQRS